MGKNALMVGLQIGISQIRINIQNIRSCSTEIPSANGNAPGSLGPGSSCRITIRVDRYPRSTKQNSRGALSAVCRWALTSWISAISSGQHQAKRKSACGKYLGILLYLLFFHSCCHHGQHWFLLRFSCMIRRLTECIVTIIEMCLSLNEVTEFIGKD